MKRKRVTRARLSKLEPVNSISLFGTFIRTQDTLYAVGVGIALRLDLVLYRTRSKAFDANKQFVDGPVNSSTSQISFLRNVISPREKVSVLLLVWKLAIVCNIILHPFTCILDWAQIVSTAF